MSRMIVVRAIILNGSKLLCVRNKRHSKSDGEFWCLPGGNVEEGEALLPALRREITEETGIEPQIGKLMYIQQFKTGGDDILEFFFHVANAQDYLNVDLSKTTHGLQEIAEIAFVDPATTHILPNFLTTEPLAQKAANSDPVQVFSYQP